VPILKGEPQPAPREETKLSGIFNLRCPEFVFTDVAVNAYLVHFSMIAPIQFSMNDRLIESWISAYASTAVWIATSILYYSPKSRLLGFESSTKSMKRHFKARELNQNALSF
jgi:hypothetical protein